MAGFHSSRHVPGFAVAVRHLPRILLTGALLWAAASTLAVYPHELAYFNEAAGGPQNGDRHLLHSNLDCGQDLLELRMWLHDHPDATPLYIAYPGYMDPRTVGIEFTVAPPARNQAARDGPHRKWWPGWYVISVNLLKGDGGLLPSGNRLRSNAPRNAYIGYNRFAPAADVGYTMRVYRISDSFAHRSFTGVPSHSTTAGGAPRIGSCACPSGTFDSTRHNG